VSWNASANSARYDPTLERDRNQPIVVTLRASLEDNVSRATLVIM
jgi:hypothetical protein